MSIESILNGIIGKEGRYSNHPNDRGGETMWGITHAVAHANGYMGPMRSMPREKAAEIYRRQYYERPGFDRVAEVSPAVAEELTDTGVNMGPAVAVIMLQKVLNGLNNQGALYGDVAEDGALGPATMRALRAYFTKRGEEGETVLLKALNCLQGARYIDIARGRPKNEAFLYGWLRTRVGL